MLIPLHNLRHIYQHILKSALELDGQGCSIFIFVSNDTDSLSSLKILLTLFKSDEVQFTAIPVFSNYHLVKEFEGLKSSSFVRSLIFINCGGSLDLTRQWFYNDFSKVKCYLFDSHRPYDHRNINDESQKIFVIHDGCKSFDECPTAEDDRIYTQLAEERKDLDSDSEDYDSELERDEDEVLKELQELQAEEEKDGEEIPISGDKKKRQEKKLKLEKYIKFQNYYRGSFYGKSSSYAFFQLCTQMNKGTKDMLWYWIIGIADFIIHSKQSELEINEESTICNDEVQKTCFDQNANAVRPDDLGILPEGADYKDKDLFKLVEGTLKSSTLEVGMIKIERELKLMLLRHWNLYDSMSNSNYMVSKLAIAREPGQKTFKKFLAQIGCPLEQAKQKYKFMDPDLRNSLKQRILDNSSDFRIEGILISSYLRQMTETIQFSATDMAYALSSLLEYPHHINAHHDSNEKQAKTLIRSKEAIDKNHQKSKKDAAEEEKNQILLQNLKDKDLVQLNNCLHDNFWVAYDALTLDNVDVALKGIELAKELQSAIIRTGNAIIEKKEIKVAQKFRYVMMENDYLVDVQLFQYPLALQKLGMFIMEDFKERRPSAKVKPLVISVKNSKTGMFLILACLGQNRELDSRNDFGERFAAAVDNLGVTAKHESFETGMVEIKIEDYRGFMNALCEIQ